MRNTDLSNVDLMNKVTTVFANGGEFHKYFVQKLVLEMIQDGVNFFDEYLDLEYTFEGYCEHYKTYGFYEDEMYEFLWKNFNEEFSLEVWWTLRNFDGGIEILLPTWEITDPLATQPHNRKLIIDFMISTVCDELIDFINRL